LQTDGWSVPDKRQQEFQRCNVQTWYLRSQRYAGPQRCVVRDRAPFLANPGHAAYLFVAQVRKYFQQNLVGHFFDRLQQIKNSTLTLPVHSVVYSAYTCWTTR
jgi:hypothetical protein